MIFRSNGPAYGASAPVGRASLLYDLVPVRTAHL